ncbi:acetyltransferase, GNAT family protein [Roseobacter sp. SK209-2-6]|uniref:GNAT family N-acetyltransferase n=1 Tax=Roseobacter sp. SK209-2-6 TaxID=388739 RepID=UPI0000F3EB48|nr:GNAT family N-acetyltransferase [Roseobacter sp. SK209-2-6]EBA15545.1 acetyltransferase, GNAT family protein [Roseobacter sp. SK209-2-6]
MDQARCLRATDEEELAAVLSLIQESFAYMEGRIDPPSSMLKLTLETLRQQCRTGEIWVIGAPPQACVFLSPHQDHLYLGKLAVAEAYRGKGLARQLLDLTLHRAAETGKQHVELQSRIELTENHRAFAAMGFHEIERTAHAGYDRPTSITMRRFL